jgi:hypothetical protein
MPSSYSDLLRLELQANGENDGTWGTLLNTAIQLIERSMHGTVAITGLTGGTVDLTTANGTEDQARYRTVTLAGTLTSNLIIEVPAKAHFYRIKNGTTGAFTCKVQVDGGAGAGVLIPQGKTLELWSDGTDVVETVGAMRKDGSGWCVVAGGTADAMTGDFVPDLTLTDGMIIAVRTPGANTVTNPTFAPDGGTARTITKNGGSALAAGDYSSGATILLQYVSATPRWELLNPKSDVGLNLANTFTATQTINDPSNTDSDLLTVRKSGATAYTTDDKYLVKLQSNNATTDAVLMAFAGSGVINSFGLKRGTNNHVLKVNTTGTPVEAMTWYSTGGVGVGSASDPGAGRINATAYYKNGTNISGLFAGTSLVLNPYTVGIIGSSGHGLASAPNLIFSVLECISADGNWPQGWKMQWGGGFGVGGGVTAFITRADSTTLYLYTHGSSVPAFPDPVTFINTNITASKWKLTVTPYLLV